MRDASIYAIIAIVAISLHLTEAEFHHECPVQQRPGTWKGVCGTNLIHHIRAVCRMKEFVLQGQSPNRRKREAGVPDLSDETLEKLVFGGPKSDSVRPKTSFSDTLKNAFLKGSQARSIIRSAHRMRMAFHGDGNSNLATWTPQNIICECCYHQCGMEEIVEYCP